MSTPTKSPAATARNAFYRPCRRHLAGLRNGGQYKHLQVLEGPMGPRSG